MNARIWPRAVLFDLDGTLIHSAPDIAAAANELMAAHRLAPFTLTEVEQMIGHGLKTLTERAFAARGLPLTPAALEARFDEMMAIYPRHLTNLTSLNAGAAEAIAASTRAGIATAVVTNKPEGFSLAILAHFGLAADVVIGGDSGFVKKPAPDMLLAACSRLGVAPADTVMVGDSGADAAASRAAGIACILVRGGYSGQPLEGLGADAMIDRLAELTSAMDRIAARQRPTGA